MSWLGSPRICGAHQEIREGILFRNFEVTWKNPHMHMLEGFSKNVSKAT